VGQLVAQVRTGGKNAAVKMIWAPGYVEMLPRNGLGFVWVRGSWCWAGAGAVSLLWMDPWFSCWDGSDVVLLPWMDSWLGCWGLG